MQRQIALSQHLQKWLQRFGLELEHRFVLRLWHLLGLHLLLPLVELRLLPALRLSHQLVQFQSLRLAELYQLLAVHLALRQ